MEPFFGFSKTGIAETDFLHGRAEQAVDERADEPTEGNRGHPLRWMMTSARARAWCQSGDERGGSG